MVRPPDDPHEDDPTSYPKITPAHDGAGWSTPRVDSLEVTVSEPAREDALEELGDLFGALGDTTIPADDAIDRR